MQNLPRQLYNVTQIKVLERVAIENCGIAGYELMTRAGQAVFDFIKRLDPQLQKITVVCGAGNNAGDGFVVARLGLLAGLQVTVYNLLTPDILQGDAQHAYRDFVAVGGVTTQFAGQIDLDADAGVIVDALLGTGLVRPVAGLFKQAIECINQHSAIKVAVDIPSGLQADTGMVLGVAVQADFTVCFIGLKQGLFTGMAPDYCGELSYTDLDVPHSVFDQVTTPVNRILPQPFAKRSRCAHKGKFGHVLVIGGDLGYSGAARLSGEAAARVGAGLVSIATRKAHAISLNATRPELMCHGIDTADELEGLLAQASVLVIGPGLGQSEWGRALFDAAITSTKPLVVDADGLNLLAKSPFRQQNWVLTPHPGEAARLLSTSTEQLQADRFAAVTALQVDYGGVVVLKGAGSLIAADNGITLSTTGNPGMASGGMGDVLSGLIGGLLAQGLSFREAAEQGVYLHGLAADYAAQAEGERGLLAGDLLPFLRKLVN